MTAGRRAGNRPRPIVLVVLDGFGIGRERAADAVAAARMPVWQGLLRDWPHAALGASAEAVGLPPGQMGNSEVGHLNLGAGRPVIQDLTRIEAAMADGSFTARPVRCRCSAQLRNSPPLSVWKSSIGYGTTCSSAFNSTSTAAALLFQTARFSVQPLKSSVNVREWT